MDSFEGGRSRPDGSVLDGSGVNIGQVEPSRVAVRGFDSEANSNAFVVPFESRTKNGQSIGPDVHVGEGHALNVASVMIGATGAPRSVSPAASLYSSGFTETGIVQDQLITTQYIAKRFVFSDSRHIRAVNHSWNDFPDVLGDLDGNSRLTLGMDWIASEFDVLNIFAGTQSGSQRFIPTDNFNGITVARSALNENGVFALVDAGNDNGQFEDAEGDRVSVDILAPGVDIVVADPGTTNPNAVETGTSFAAPHVVGAVALLNEYADFQTQNAVPRWDYDNARKHEVMKAVLLNSADKLPGKLGSGKEIINEDGLRWNQTQAFFDDTISLDQQMGAGHLNAASALRQFRKGEYDQGGFIQRIGWDYGETGGTATDLRYTLGQFNGGHVAITLAWDRGIIKSGGLDDTYDPSNIFTGQTVDDLDLFLVPFGTPTNELYSESIKSIATDDNVEHIFEQVPAGNYEIAVYQTSGGERDFGLAWWFGNFPSGDFDDDGDIDGHDLDEWRDSFGMSPGADADGDGDSDGADFLVWQRNLGTTSASPSFAAMPEPRALMLAALGMPWLVRLGQRAA